MSLHDHTVLLTFSTAIHPSHPPASLFFPPLHDHTVYDPLQSMQRGQNTTVGFDLSLLLQCMTRRNQCNVAKIRPFGFDLSLRLQYMTRRNQCNVAIWILTFSCYKFGRSSTPHLLTPTSYSPKPIATPSSTIVHRSLALLARHGSPQSYQLQRRSFSATQTNLGPHRANVSRVRKAA